MMDPIYHYDIDQGSEEWKAIRSGRATASVIKTFLVDGKGPLGFGPGAITQILRITEERLTGKPRESFGGSKATDHGHYFEPLAAEHYERITFRKVKEVGFVSVGDWLGCSPDRLIGDDGGLEIKCLPVNHMEIIDTGKYKTHDDNVKQCQMNLWVTKRKWWDLEYYHDDFPDHLKAKIFRIEPDRILHAKLDQRMKDFQSIVNQKLLIHKK